MKTKALVVMTLASPNKYDGQVAEWADTLVRLSCDGNRARAELLKHPSKQPMVSAFKMDGLLRPTTRVRVFR
jgi:hypothetical protein